MFAHTDEPTESDHQTLNFPSVQQNTELGNRYQIQHRRFIGQSYLNCPQVSKQLMLVKICKRGDESKLKFKPASRRPESHQLWPPLPQNVSFLESKR